MTNTNCTRIDLPPTVETLAAGCFERREIPLLPTVVDAAYKLIPADVRMAIRTEFSWESSTGGGGLIATLARLTSRAPRLAEILGLDSDYMIRLWIAAHQPVAR